MYTLNIVIPDSARTDLAPYFEALMLRYELTKQRPYSTFDGIYVQNCTSENLSKVSKAVQKLIGVIENYLDNPESAYSVTIRRN